MTCRSSEEGRGDLQVSSRSASGSHDLEELSAPSTIAVGERLCARPGGSGHMHRRARAGERRWSGVNLADLSTPRCWQGVLGAEGGVRR